MPDLEKVFSKFWSVVENLKLSIVHRSIPSDSPHYAFIDFIGFKKVTLRLPLDHPLPIYLTRYPYYDKFVPILSALLDGIIIDVGANIGDTALQICSLSDNIVISVEPSPIYIEVMNENIALNSLGSQISVYPHALSSVREDLYIINNSLNSTSSLAPISRLSNDIAKAQLDVFSGKHFSELLSHYKICVEDIALLKIDVDSRDWDCINSFLDVLSAAEPSKALPIVYFELCPQDPYGAFIPFDASILAKEYAQSFESLLQHGYDFFWVFDNFGSPLVSINSIEQFVGLIDYVHFGHISGDPRLYYYDVVCGVSKMGHDAVISQAIAKMINRHS